MNRLRAAFAALLLLVGLAAQPAVAAWVDYTPEAFSAAQAEGKTILVDVTASWCPTCRAQKPILDELAADPAMEGVLFVRLDFDQHKDFLREHRVPRQSTIIVFEGAEEVNRSVAETDRDRLRDFVFLASGR